MDRLQKQLFILQKAAQNRHDSEGAKVYWSRHAVAELVNDNLTRAQVEQALEQGEIIEEYPIGHRGLPDCLVLAKLSETQPMHVVIAIGEAKDRVFVITVYVPSAERWHDDWRTRK